MRKIEWLLICFFGLIILIPIGLMVIFPWPSGTTPGTKYGITFGLMIIFFIGWMGIYRKTRPNTPEYYAKKNRIGAMLLLIAAIFCLALLILNFFMISSDGVADLTFTEYLTRPILTWFDLSLSQMLTDWGHVLAAIRFQFVFTLIYVSIGFLAAPKQQSESAELIQKKGIFGGIMVIGVLLLIQILIWANFGYIWVGTEGRWYFFFGLYDEDFTLKLIPNLIFMAMGFVYLGFRQSFWSDYQPQVASNIAQWLIIAALVFFNILYSIIPIYPQTIINSISIAYFLFCFINMLVCFGTLFILQARHAEMGVKPPRWLKLGGNLSWIGLLFGFVLYLALFLILDVGINIQLSDVFYYYPNLLFEILLTYAIYYLGLWMNVRFGGSIQAKNDHTVIEKEGIQ